MSDPVEVELEWIADRFANNDRLVTVAHFAHQTEQEFHQEAWSVVLDLKRDSSGRIVKALASFLVPDAPHGWLRSHAFTLLDGTRPVARAKPLTDRR